MSDRNAKLFIIKGLTQSHNVKLGTMPQSVRQRNDMIKRMILVLLLGLVVSFVTACSKKPTVVGNNDLQRIRKLFLEGKYEEALQQQLWFHEASKTSPGMGGVRLSYALSQWLELGQKYPKALDALKSIRDQHEKMLLSGKGGYAEFSEYSSINKILKEDDKTYNVFKQLHAQYPDIAVQCFRTALDLIIERKDYELCGAYIKDPVKWYEEIRQMREMSVNIAKTNPTLNNAMFKDYMDGAFVKQTSQLIDIMINLKKWDDAKEIQKRALRYLPDHRLEEAIPAS
jgi:tetratricopeptide (TPR) repeat protein